MHIFCLVLACVSEFDNVLLTAKFTTDEMVHALKELGPL